MISLPKVSRTKKELKDVFENRIREIQNSIVMGEFSDSKIVFVVEGKLDNGIFSKLRLNNSFEIVSIEDLIAATVNQNDKQIERQERKKLVSAKIAVDKVTQMFNKTGISVLGIQDEDYDAIIDSFHRGDDSKEDKENIVTTFPSTDIETLFYSMLIKKSKITFFDRKINRKRKLDVEKNRMNCENLAIARIAALIYQKEQRKNIGKLSSDGQNIPSIRKLEPVWEKTDREGSLQKQNEFRIFTGEIELLLEKIQNQGRFTDTIMFTMYVEKCKQIKDYLSEKKYPWDYYIRGHDLEWFIRYNNELGTDYLRHLVIKRTSYNLLKDHNLFKRIEVWREGKGFPKLFKPN